MSNAGWRDYWRENRLAACVPENPASAALIEQRWCDFFAELPDGTRILDIATGNGVLLVWADRAARERGRRFVMTGIDLADIDPARFLPSHQDALSAAQFFGAVSAEALPFDDNSFDLVVSQYGLEYADLSRALGEAARVLRPGGQLQWLAHDETSIVVAQGARRLEDIELLLARSGAFAAMRSYLDARLRGRKENRALKELTVALRHAEAYCRTHSDATLVRQLCGGILDTVNSIEKYRPEDVQVWLDENLRRLKNQRRRIRDLQAARLTPERLDQVKEMLNGGPWLTSAIDTLAFSPTEAMRETGQQSQSKESLGLFIHSIKS